MPFPFQCLHRHDVGHFGRLLFSFKCHDRHRLAHFGKVSFPVQFTNRDFDYISNYMRHHGLKNSEVHPKLFQISNWRQSLEKMTQIVILRIYFHAPSRAENSEIPYKPVRVSNCRQRGDETTKKACSQISIMTRCFHAPSCAE
jgi:hypothetical protein